MREWLDDAAIVVLADVVESSDGIVTIRPTNVFRGELPAVAGGLYRFEWRDVEVGQSGVWLFDADGSPYWVQDDADDVPVPQYPWTDQWVMLDAFLGPTSTEPTGSP